MAVVASFEKKGFFRLIVSAEAVGSVSVFDISEFRIKWEIPKIRGALFWGPYNKDPTIWGSILGSPIFGNSRIIPF